MNKQKKPVDLVQQLILTFLDLSSQPSVFVPETGFFFVHAQFLLTFLLNFMLA